MQQPRLARCDKPPPAGPKDVVIRITPEESFDGFVLSQYFWGTFLHFDHRIQRTRECLEDADACPGCVARMERRWKGYLHVISRYTPLVGFLELPKMAAVSLEGLFQPGEKFRGAHITARRMGKGKKCRVEIQRHHYTQPQFTLPEAQDPEAVLRMLWNWQDYRSR